MVHLYLTQMHSPVPFLSIYHQTSMLNFATRQHVVVFVYIWLPCLLGHGLAFPRLAVEVGRGGVLDGGLFFSQVGCLDQWLVEQFLLAEDAAGGLVVGEHGELE